MHAEYPPDLDIARTIEPIAFCDPVSCSMRRMEHRCPNDADQGMLCVDSQGRRFIVPQCSLCAHETQEDTLAPQQQLANKILARFEFSPEYRHRIAMSDILKAVEETGRAMEMKIANTLKAYGATNERTNVGARWNGLRWRA